MLAELFEVLANLGYGGQPAIHINAEQCVEVILGHVERRGVKRTRCGQEPNRGAVHGRLAVNALEYPFEHARVFAEARPDVAAVGVTTKPVDEKNLRQFCSVGLLANFYQ